MSFEKFEGPWNGTELLGCRNLFCGERLIVDLFEYLQSGPDEDLTVGTENGFRSSRDRFDYIFANLVFDV